MQDRIDMYNNRDLEDQQFDEPPVAAEGPDRVRKTSRVMFDHPQVVNIEGEVNVVETATEAEVHHGPGPAALNKPAASRIRKVSKVSMFDFVQEEN